MLPGILCLSPFALVTLIWLLHKGHKEFVADLDPQEKQDFAIGFFGMIVLNICLFVLLRWISQISRTPATWNVVFVPPWIVNIGLLLFFGFYRRRIAQGALAFIGLALTWPVLAGMLFFASCFIIAGVLNVVLAIVEAF